MTKIAFVTTQVAPFQIEFASAMNALPGVEYRVIFCHRQNVRPPYWLSMGDEAERFSTTYDGEPNESANVEWAVKQLEAYKPDVVLIGGVRGIPAKAALKFRQITATRTPLGYWMEPPLLQPNILKRGVRRLEYLWRLSRVDFVLAIGDRAHAYYRGCNSNAHFVPYGPDLSDCFDAVRSPPNPEKTRFLFSGGLHKRHNFPMILESFRRLMSTHKDRFEFVVSGSGLEQSVFDKFVRKHPEMADVIVYDRDFNSWQERLGPFINCDVFIYPTNHAGWGIVIPEAMSAGMCVITSDKAESSRYLVRHEETGLFVDTTVESFTDALSYCIDNPDRVAEMGKLARISAKRNDAPFVANQLMNALHVATGGKI